MRIQDYLNVIIRRWWVICLVGFSAAAAAYVISKLQTPIFRSQATYSVLPNRVDSGVMMFTDRLLNGYVNLVYQPDQLQAVSNRLGLDQTGNWLMQYVRVQPQPQEMKIVIEADHFDPASAQQIAAAVGETLNSFVVEQNRTLQGEDQVNLYRAQAATAAVRAKPNTKINVLAGGLLGGVLGLLLSFMLDWMDDTLKNSADVERFAGLTTIGAIPAGGSQHRRGRSRLRPAAAAGFVAGDRRAPSNVKRNKEES